jgi:hypothetical protein
MTGEMDPPMSLIRCPFCEQGDAADAKFCSECGGALHLVPCPSCGAINQVTSSACYQCRRPLQGGGAAAPAPSLPTDTDLLDLFRDPTLQERGAAASAPSVPRELSDLFPDSISGTVVPESLPVAVVRESLPRRRSRAIIGTATVAVVVAILALGYNTYRQRSLIDEPPPQQAGNGATDRGAASGVIRRNAAVGAPGSPSAAIPATAAILPETSPATPTHAAVDQPRAGRLPAESQKSKAAFPVARPPAGSERRASSTQGPIAPEACTEAGAALGLCVMSPARKKALETAAAVGAGIGRAPTTGSRSSGGQERARPEECTEAVAALGLCPQGITQGRE